MIALVFLPAIVFALQSASFKQYSLKCDNTFGASSLFTTIYLALSALFVLPFIFIFDSGMNVDSIIYGAVFGVFFYIFILMYGEAIKSGPLSITTFIFSISMIVPIILSIILFDESVTIFKIIGFLLMLVGIYLINFANSHRKSEDKNTFSKKWLVFCIVGAIFNAATMFTNKYFGIKVVGGSVYQYLFVACVIATILSCFTFIAKKVREDLRTLNIDKWYVVLAIVVALANVIGNGLIAFLGGKVSGSIMFPIVNGLSVTLSTLFGVFFFKEKLHVKSIVGLSLGIVAIVLLSI